MTGVQFLAGAVNTSSRHHLASYPVGSRGPFPWR